MFIQPNNQENETFLNSVLEFCLAFSFEDRMQS